MCLAIPGQIIERWEENGAPFARADFAGEERRISLAFLPDLGVGDYVIVHAGFALTHVPEQNVAMVMQSIREAGLLDPEFADYGEAVAL